MRASRVLGPALALLLAGAAAGWAQTDEEAARRRELEEVQRRARENREAAQRLKPQETQAIGQLRRSERQLSLTRRRLRDLTKRQRNLDLQLEVTRLDLQRNMQSLYAQRGRLSHRLREIYKFGPARELEFLLSTNSFAQLLTRWDFLIMLAEQDRQILNSVRDRKETVETLERRLEGHLDQVERTTRQTSSENKRLASQRQERATAVREIQTQRQAYESAANELERTARSIQQVLARLERRRREEAEARKSQGKPPAPYTGDFARAEGALEWPARGEVVGRFGPERNPRFPKVEILNNGIDIEVPIGTPVRSVAKGKVDYVSGDYGTYGQMVIINHGDSYYTLYAHLADIGVAVGQEVAAGATIGASGDTGSLKGPILHFEVRRGATALDPERWLR